MSDATTPQDLALATADVVRDLLATYAGSSLEELGLPVGALAAVRPPRPEMGDLAFPCFPLAEALRKNPAQIASELAQAAPPHLEAAAASGSIPPVAGCVAAGPYLNLTFEPGSLAGFVLGQISSGQAPYGAALPPTGRSTMVEYSAPNTNKPMHVGHVRNNLLGLSLCRILEAAGEEVIPVNLVNDRGVHIAKSMLAYQKWGAGKTPESEGQKGDHFVGKLYVRFGMELAREKAALAEEAGLDPQKLDKEKDRELEDRAPLTLGARALLRKWEQGDPEVRALWERMNRWVYSGFDETYHRLGCTFRKWYFESNTYQLGKKIIDEGVARGLFHRHPDGSIWAHLEDEGLKDKILIRSDGTSVYITQDLGTAVLKFEDFDMDRSVYVVASEQNLHFRILFRLLRQLEMPWAAGCVHLSYGMVNLPHGQGKLKSREGRTADADALLDELGEIAHRKAVEGGYATEAGIDLDALADIIGQGALKMYLLQVGAEKDIQFDPDATLDFEGDTGPAVQYSHARICSIARKALAKGMLAAGDLASWALPDPFADLGTGSPVRAPAEGPWRKAPSGGAAQPAAGDAAAAAVRSAVGLCPDRADPALLVREEERRVSLELASFPAALRQAAAQLSPSPVAAHLLELTKAYARFYHACPVLRAESQDLMRARLHLSLAVAATLRRGLSLLGIQAPDAM